jgi:hypothetical protein
MPPGAAPPEHRTSVSHHLTGGGVRMSEMPPGLPRHPVGTFAFVGAYAVVFVILWFAIYLLIYMARQPVTP